MEDLNEMARMHSAGATVSHQSPFIQLNSLSNNHPISIDILKKWVVPYYMEIGSYNGTGWISSLKQRKQKVTKDLCLELLGDFNWRTRLVGSYFAAIKNYTDLIDVIGVHLLKSEVCCVGHIYAITLAYFNTNKCTGYLNKYLEYYLRRPDLHFDQDRVLEAVLYLDEVNKTNNFGTYTDCLKEFRNERQRLRFENGKGIAKIIEDGQGKANAEKYLESLERAEEVSLSAAYVDEQVAILRQIVAD